MNNGKAIKEELQLLFYDFLQLQLEFANKHNSSLTILKNGEHWFHTEEQLAFLDKWLRTVINPNDTLH